MNNAGRLVMALLAGGLVGSAGAIVLAGDNVPDPVAAPAATTSTSVAPPLIVEAPWLDGGVRFRSSVVTTRAFVVGEGQADLEFEVIPLHWTADGEEELFPREVPVRPEAWELTTEAGATYTATTTVDDTRVRFEVPDDTEAGDVASVAIVGWRVAAPVQDSLTIPLIVGERRSFANGATVQIETVLDQTNSTIVQLDSRRAETAWLGGNTLAPVTVRDAGWRSGFSQSSNIQLIWEGSGAPGTIELFQAAPEWTAVAAYTMLIGGE